MSKKINRFLKIYPWFSGLTADLLFYIAIDTLFLKVVKEFSAAQIVSLTTVSTIACILLQFPLLKVIQKIGNTASVRVGGLLLLLSSLCITFGPNYYVIVLGRLLHDVAAIFRSAVVVALKNNLEQVDKRQDFVRMRTKANTVYAVLTMLISFVASFLFNLNRYLPMYGCITTCLIGFVLSFFIVDHSPYNKISRMKDGQRIKLHYSKLLILAIAAYGLFYPLVNLTQSDGKLFIQQHMLNHYSVDNTSLMIGAIICVSRILRVISNLVFARIYKHSGAKVGIYLPALLCSSVACIAFGSFVPWVPVRIVVMGLGYVTILFLRDPFRLFVQDVVFEHTAKEFHQTLLATMEFGVRVGRASMSLCFSMVLLKYSMLAVVMILFAFSVIEVLLCLRFYKCILMTRKQKENSLIA